MPISPHCTWEKIEREATRLAAISLPHEAGTAAPNEADGHSLNLTQYP
jgi:hypothetical protein